MMPKGYHKILQFIAKLKKYTDTEEKKRLLSNFLFLSLLQGANYILPLMTLPYLVRVLGVEYFGLLAFATALITYFQVITDYGFNLTATREISIYRDNKQKVLEIYSSVMTIKVVLTVLSFLLLLILVFSFKKFSGDWEVYVFTFGTVIGQVLFPTWFFQGMECMKYITYLNILTKSLFTVAVFIFVQQQSDFRNVPILLSMGNIITGIWSLIIIKKKFGVTFQVQSMSTIKHYLTDGWHVFISNIAISLYTVSTTFILGLFTNNIVVGYFAAADKLIQAFKSLMGPVFQTLYPYITKKVHISKTEGLRIIRTVTIYIGIFTFLVSAFIFIFSGSIIHILLGDQYSNSIVLLRIMAPLPFMIALSNIFGVQTMLSFGKKQAFSRILLIGSVLNLILSMILVPMFEQVGSAISVTIVEIFITIAMTFYVRKIGLRL